MKLRTTGCGSVLSIFRIESEQLKWQKWAANRNITTRDAIHPFFHSGSNELGLTLGKTTTWKRIVIKAHYSRPSAARLRVECRQCVKCSTIFYGSKRLKILSHMFLAFFYVKELFCFGKMNDSSNLVSKTLNIGPYYRKKIFPKLPEMRQIYLAL